MTGWLFQVAGVGGGKSPRNSWKALKCPAQLAGGFKTATVQ